MKRILLLLIAALVTSVMLTGCFWEEERHEGDRDREHGQMHNHDRDYDRDYDRDRR